MSEFFSVFINPEAWIAILTLVFLEVVLGIDNIVFLSIMSNKAPEEKRAKVRTIGLLLAMLGRIGFLCAISWLMTLDRPLYVFESENIVFNINIRSIIILFGGLFLLYKSVKEIHHKMELRDDDEEKNNSKKNSIFVLITEIFLLDLIFSIDSVLTAVGMVSQNEFGKSGALSIMILAIVVAVIIMMLFSGPISKFVNKHPSIQMLALSFLILIGVTLLVEACHLATLQIYNSTIGEIPKGYIYFAIFFSLGVEMLNLRFKKKQAKKVKE